MLLETAVQECNGLEFYHNFERYTCSGMTDFFEQVSDYFIGLRSTPVSKTNSFCGRPEVLFCFVDDFLKDFSRDKKFFEKSYETALKYSFDGFSRGGRNGIFYQSEYDGKMILETDRMIRKYEDEIVDLFEIDSDEVRDLKKIKAVCHNPCGKRMVGVYHEKNQKIVFLGFAFY